MPHRAQVRGGTRNYRSVAAEAARLGVSVGWIYREIREQRFPHVPLGGRILLDPIEVDAFLRQAELNAEAALNGPADA